MSKIEEFWYPIKVKNNTEYIVFSKILKNGFKAYMPLVRYHVKKNERDFWKLKPIFKGKLFVYCQSDKLLHLQSIENNMKFYFRERQPEYIESQYIEFMKKGFASNNEVEVVNKEINGTFYITIDTPNFGLLTLNKSIFREKEVISWPIPVIKNTLIIEPDSIFLKFLIYESQDYLV